MEKQDDESLGERLVSLTRDLVSIPGTEERPDDLRRALEWVGHHLDGVEGLRLEELESGGVASLLARPVGVEAPEVMMFGHVDVVHHADPRVYRTELREGCIVGPGAGDMKGTVAVMVELLRVLHRERPGVSVGLAITTDEERGGTLGTRALVEEHGLRCGVAVVPDGGSLDEIVVEEKGILHAELHARGSACHAARPWLGANALERLVESLDAIGRRFPPEEDEEHWYATCSVTRLGTDNRSFNRVPSRARATLDLRFPAPRTVAEIVGMLRGAVSEGVEVEPVIAAEPSLLSPDPEFLRCFEERLGRRPRTLREHGGSDARFLAAHRIPVIMNRPLCGRLHARDEWIEVGSMIEFFRLHHDYLRRRLGLA